MSVKKSVLFTNHPCVYLLRKNYKDYTMDVFCRITVWIQRLLHVFRSTIYGKSATLSSPSGQ